MVGGTGDDTYIVDNLGDTVTELANGGHDSVGTNVALKTAYANVEDYSFNGSGDWTFTGNALDNLISSAKGRNDKLNGGAGNDTLFGVDGDDTLTGGTGNDTFGFSATHNEGKDTITDFNGKQDILAFSDVVDSGNNGIFDDINATVASVVDAGKGHDVTVTFNSGSVLVFSHAGTGNIDAITDLVADPAHQII
jgi:serralysin